MSQPCIQPEVNSPFLHPKHSGQVTPTSVRLKPEDREALRRVCERLESFGFSASTTAVFRAALHEGIKVLVLRLEDLDRAEAMLSHFHSIAEVEER